MGRCRNSKLFASLSLLTAIAALISACRCDEKQGPSMAAPPPVERPKPCQKCNVLLVTFDALRADHMGIYGYGRNTTPNMDAFGREAYVFTDAMSQAGTTVISLPSLFTSKFPWTDELYQKQGTLNLDENERL
jgi:glucan phosphoethanolaminetransferase (alkaline phosphatase superfamily)